MKKTQKKRTQSLNIHKKRHTLQLPKFYSRDKNNIHNIKIEQTDSQYNSSKHSSKNEKINLGKDKIAGLVSRIKLEKQQPGEPKTNKKNISQKKITANNFRYPTKQSNAHIKMKNMNQGAFYEQSAQASKHRGQRMHQRKLTTDKSQKINEQTPPHGIKQFRSKSLKNAIKIGNNQQSLFMSDVPHKSSNKQQNAKKFVTEQTKNNESNRKQVKNKINFNNNVSIVGRNIINQDLEGADIQNHTKIYDKNIRGKKVQSYIKDIDTHKGKEISAKMELHTEDTQTANNYFLQTQKKYWQRTVQIMHNMCKNPQNLNWPEEYIVTDKFITQKKMYAFFDDSKMLKMKQKYKKHICIARVTMFLLAHLIVNEMQTHFLVFIVERIRDSYIKILDISGKSIGNKMPPETLLVINKNNQLALKQLHKVLSRKSVPKRNLLQNMLESSIKIQSFQFIEILDKTLKWQLLKMPSYPYLPAPQKDMFLVLDLDETLIHYSYEDQMFHVRPFTEEFLKKASKRFEIIIFTAAIQEYADQIIGEIDPEHSVSYKLYRNHLTYLDGMPIKDLSMLGRPLNKTIIVDNLSSNFRLQPQNGIQIRSWYNDDDDQILGKLYALLIKMADNHSDDIRKGIRQYSDFIKEQITKNQLIYELKKQL